MNKLDVNFDLKWWCDANTTNAATNYPGSWEIVTDLHTIFIRHMQI